MSIETTDCIDNIPGIAEWALQTQVWNGRQVSWNEASDFCEEVQSRILDLLFQNADHPAIERLAAQLAWLGSTDANRTLLARDIQALDFSNQDRILQVGFGKSISKFWKKHKYEILFGAAALAVVTVVVVVAVSTGGVAAGGGAALDRLNKKDSDQEKEKNNTCVAAAAPPPPPKGLPIIPPAPSISLDPYQSQFGETGIPPSPYPFPSPSFDPSGKLLFGERGILVDGRFSSYDAILQSLNDPPSRIQPPPSAFEPNFPTSPPISSEKSWIANILDTLGTSNIEPDLLIPDLSSCIEEPSIRFSTVGIRDPHLSICNVNGINTTMEEARGHAAYLASFAPNRSVDWVYNRSHGPVIDFAEVVTLNYLGISPNTAQVLKENWTAFHEENKDHPHAKYLQFCHSQGTIHVRNALARAPKEIRDRVIVVAIAPAAVVPKEICFQSFNYACKNDIVPYCELGFVRGLDPDECGMSISVERVLNEREEIIFLEPDPNATENVHYFQNPTYRKKIEDHIVEYLNNNGECQ